ncbi:hypothetical protein AN1V17_00710 [Vallitalea sediminicola]
MISNKMMKKHEKALNELAIELKSIKEVEGILLFGSVQRGEARENSDIDLNVIVNCNESWNYKKRVCGVLAEVYFSPYFQWEKLIKEDRNIAVLRAFSTGTFIYKKESTIEQLKELATMVIEEGPKPLKSVQVANWRIKLSELLEDLMFLPEDSPQSYILANNIINITMEAFCQLNNLWSVKLEKMLDYISKYNSELYKMIVNFYKSNIFSISQVEEIVDIVLKPFGGRLLEYEGPRLTC